MRIRIIVAKFSLVGLFLIAFAPSAVVEARPRWELLGEANVDGAVDHDVIRVGRADGTFRAIQIKVRGGAIDFQRVIVHFGNGSDVPVEMRTRIPAGGQTRNIDLPGDRRVISSVEFFYAKANWASRRPKVLLYGMR